MFIKRICRKPMLYILLLASIFAGNTFQAVTKDSMRSNLVLLDAVYEGITIKCGLLPQTHTGAELLLDANIGRSIMELDEVREYYCEMNCPYYFRDPGPSSDNSKAFGTNNIQRFASEHGLILSSKAAEVDFSQGGDKTDICIISEELSKAASRSTGDKITVAGSETVTKKDENAPNVILTIAGTYKQQTSGIPWNCIIVPSACFFETGKLITTSEGIRKWQKYNAFDFAINPAYNKTFDEVKTKLRGIIGKEYMLYSSCRELESAARPLEEKLNMQGKIFNFISVILVLLPAFITLLMCKKNTDELFIRMLYGEKRLSVFIKTFLPLTVLLLLLFCFAAITANFRSCDWRYMLSVAAVSVFTAAVTIGVICKTRLLKLYQLQEE